MTLTDRRVAALMKAMQRWGWCVVIVGGKAA